MGIKISLNYKAIEKLEQSAQKAAAIAMEALHTDVVSTQVMPFDTGDMQNNETFTDVSIDDSVITTSLITGSPQSRRLYYHPEYNFQRVNNPNAGGLWLEPWITGEKKEFVEDTFKRTYRKEAGL